MKLTWKDNMLFIGKICVGGIEERLAPEYSPYYIGNIKYVGISTGEKWVRHSADCLYFKIINGESEARVYLENFVKEQAL